MVFIIHFKLVLIFITITRQEGYIYYEKYRFSAPLWNLIYTKNNTFYVYTMHTVYDTMIYIILRFMKQ